MKRNKESGFALVYAVSLSVVATLLCSAMLTYSIASHKVATTKHNLTRAEYMAEGAIEAARKVLQEAVANWQDPPAGGTVVVENFTADYTFTDVDADTIRTEPSGIQTIVDAWRIDAKCEVRGFVGHAHRIVCVESTPIFQFAIFYDNDLEILPGPDMTISGRVHCNRDIYAGAGGTLSLNTNYLRAVGNIYRHRKDNPSASDGTVRVRRWVEDPFDPSEPVDYFRMNSRSQMGGVPSQSGYDAHFTDGWDANKDGDFDDAGEWLPWAPGSLEYWSQPDGYSGGTGYTVQTNDHGVTEAVPPSVASIKMFEEAPSGGDYSYNSSTGTYEKVASGTGTHQKGFFHRTADLSIITKDDGSWSAYDSEGHDLSALVAGAVSVKEMYDGRQAAGSSTKIKVTEVDMAALNASGAFPANGVLYSAHYGEGTNLDAKGVRLTNAAELAGKLTVVSEDPVYVKGDYNTVNKKGAAIIADAVNLLSNSWNDTKTKGTLPYASETTYNFAMVTGNYSTQVGSYNGGFENLPRFHENWSGVNANIRGSFVNLWESDFATGAWVYGGDRYTAPRRNWNYDSDFNNIANLPPFTPMAVTARDVVSW